MSATTPTPTATLERFQAFAAHHGSLESPISDRILGYFMERSIGRFFDYPGDGKTTLSQHVASEFKQRSPEILALLELAADWSADPMKAAERQLRANLDAKAKAEADAKKAKEDADTAAAIHAKAEVFAAQLKSGALSLA